MKIAVIGANGRSGRIFIESALSRGHTINAGVHIKNKLLENEKVKIFKCDATNKQELRELLKGQEVVVSLIGHVKGSSATMQSDAIKAIIEVMDELKIKRLVSLTGTGVRVPGDKITFIDRILNWGVLLVDPKRIRDGIEHVRIIEKSDLDWTVVRVLKLQNIKPMRFDLLEHGPTKLLVSREDVARAILEVIEDNSFIRKYPILSKKQ